MLYIRFVFKPFQESLKTANSELEQRLGDISAETVQNDSDDEFRDTMQRIVDHYSDVSHDTSQFFTPDVSFMKFSFTKVVSVLP